MHNHLDNLLMTIHILFMLSFQICIHLTIKIETRLTLNMDSHNLYNVFLCVSVGSHEKKNIKPKKKIIITIIETALVHSPAPVIQEATC